MYLEMWIDRLSRHRLTHRLIPLSTYKARLNHLSLDMLKLRVLGYVTDVSRFLSLAIYDIKCRKVHMNACYPFGVCADLLLWKYFPLTLHLLICNLTFCIYVCRFKDISELCDNIWNANILLESSTFYIRAIFRHILSLSRVSYILYKYLDVIIQSHFSYSIHIYFLVTL